MKRFKQFLNGILVGSLIFGSGLVVEMKYTNHIKQENIKLYKLLDEAVAKNNSLKELNTKEGVKVLNIKEDDVYIEIDSEIYKVKINKEDFQKVEY